MALMADNFLAERETQSCTRVIYGRLVVAEITRNGEGASVA